MCDVCRMEGMADEETAKIEPDGLKALEGEVLGILVEGVRDLADDTRSALGEFMRTKAREIAREKWRALKAADPSERAEAETNLAHLYAQVQGEVMAMKIRATKQAKAIVAKVLEVGIDALRRFGPKLLGL